MKEEMMTVGLLLIRVVVGLLLFGHAAQKLFGWFGGHGLAGTGAFFDSIGYRLGRRLAFLAGLAELTGGLLLTLGLLTPLAAAIIIGTMIAAAAVHMRNGLWVQNGGYETPLLWPLRRGTRPARRSAVRHDAPTSAGEGAGSAAADRYAASEAAAEDPYPSLTTAGAPVPEVTHMPRHRSLTLAGVRGLLRHAARATAT
ncbi:DoxX family protein [Streptomyces mirabilis]|uniref:DoxX family protein n=1 Tax=Streptomyces mirabilis TaxID=68239 RepID=UPI0033A15374